MKGKTLLPLPPGTEKIPEDQVVAEEPKYVTALRSWRVIMHVVRLKLVDFVALLARCPKTKLC